MTILLPWATLGSNINWCDVLVSGGTGPGLGEFSEVGSGAIHFNFTPRGDKATGSLLGGVTEGVFLDRPRLFIGGNGSLIGPSEAEFGAITGAGGRFGGQLRTGLNPPLPPLAAEAVEDFDLQHYGAVKRLVESQVRFIAHLSALEAWYAGVREHLAGSDLPRKLLYERARQIVSLNTAERIGQLDGLVSRVDDSVQLLYTDRPGDSRIPQQWALVNAWPEIRPRLESHASQHEEPPAALLEALDEAATREGPAYTRIIRALPSDARAVGAAWLEGIVARIAPPDLLAQVPDLPPRS